MIELLKIGCALSYTDFIYLDILHVDQLNLFLLISVIKPIGKQWAAISIIYETCPWDSVTRVQIHNLDKFCKKLR